MQRKILALAAAVALGAAGMSSGAMALGHGGGFGGHMGGGGFGGHVGGPAFAGRAGGFAAGPTMGARTFGGPGGRAAFARGGYWGRAGWGQRGWRRGWGWGPGVALGLGLGGLYAYGALTPTAIPMIRTPIATATAATHMSGSGSFA
jgi:hypothetical protein